MPFPLFRGWHTALLLLLPAALSAQPVDSSLSDTMVAIEMRAIEVPVVEEWPLSRPPSLDATSSYPLHLFIVPTIADSAANGLQDSIAPTVAEAAASAPQASIAQSIADTAAQSPQASFAPTVADNAASAQPPSFDQSVADTAAYSPQASMAPMVVDSDEYPQLSIAPTVVDSGLVRALVSSADMHMGSNELALAMSEYKAAADADPDNVGALVGYGYASAWSGHHDDAADAFHRVLAIDDRNADAAKGLAYVAHWRGRDDESAARFGALAAENPEDAELAMMHARTLLADRRLADARAAYQRVLALDPDNIDARNGLQIASTATPKVELSTWVGLTWFDDDERPFADPNAGIRFVEVAIWPTATSRIWFQYDNGLTLDNVVLSAGNRGVPAGYIGGFLNYGETRAHTTRFELGWRSLPGSVGQTLIRSEHVVTLPGRYALKGGLWLGFRTDDRTEWIGHAGLTVPVTDAFELSPTFFYASNGMPNETEWRLLLSGEYRFANGLQLSGGLAGGQATTGYIDDYRGISDRYLKISLPVGRANRAHALLRTEFIGETDATTILSVGFTVGLAER